MVFRIDDAQTNALSSHIISLTECWFIRNERGVGPTSWVAYA